MKTLKSLILFLIAALPVLHFSSCEKVKDLAAVDVVYTLPQMNFTYQPSLAKSGEVLMYSGAVHINLDSLLSKYGLDGGIIGNTVVTSFSITTGCSLHGLCFQPTRISPLHRRSEV